MLVREIMTSPAVTIGANDEAAQAARVLDRLNLTSLPVVDNDHRLIGIISEADVVARLATASDAFGERPRVSALMTRRVLSVSADDDLTSVMDLMTGTALKSLPVRLHGRVIGMVSRRDVVRAFAHGDLDARTSDELTST